jgi:putative tryptophan/tyrosine transport system substrate-binding protein
VAAVAYDRRLFEDRDVPRRTLVDAPGPITAVAIVVVTLAVAWTSAVGAQSSSKLPVIGVLATGQARTQAPYPALERALRARGLVEGQNVRIDFRLAEGHVDRLPALAAELVRANVDVMLAGGPLHSLEAARRATRTLPIVMVAVDYDPVATGMVDSLRRPGGNITGVFIRQVELTPKRVEILKEIAPQARQVAILSDRFSGDQLKMAETTALTFGLHPRPLPFTTPPYDYAAAFAMLAEERSSSAALVTIGPQFFRDRAVIAQMLARLRIPTMFPLPEFADAGGLIAYGANLDTAFETAASYIDRILKGARPGDLPIEQPRAFELVVNMKTARATGVTIPPSVLLRADRLIQKP